MPVLRLAAALAALLAAARPCAADDGTWTLDFLTAGAAAGAVCLDGSPGAYYTRAPLNNASSEGVILYFEGGGWCSSVNNCYERSLTDLGSSKHYPAVPPGVLPPGPSYEGAALFASPPFASFTVVYAKYCDGGSWTGDNATVPVVKGASLFFRGRRLLDALLAALAPGLARAPQVLVAGCSAGALTAYTHVDYIASTLPHALVLGLADAMFALEVSSWPGPNTQTYVAGMFDFVASNWDPASARPVNAACLAHFGAAGRVHCLYGATAARFVATPTLIVNSKYDTWQEVSIMGLNKTDCPATVSPAGVITLCTPAHKDMAAFWVRYGDEMVAALAQLPPRFGAFLTNCPAHCETGTGWANPAAGTTLGEAVTAWYAAAVVHARDPAWVAPRVVAGDAEGCAAARAASKPYAPCFMPYSAFTRATESPCFTKEGALGAGVTVRRYAAATDNGATLVSSNESAALQPWDNGLEITANHMFEYFEGNGNAGGVNLTAYVTAPLMFRPASATRPWGVDMVLQPSAWPAKSHPPQPARGFVQLTPFSPLDVAVLHRVVATPPTQADFEACDAALRAVVAASSAWSVNTAGLNTPTFAFYFPRDDGILPTAGPYDIECWVEVSAK